MRNAAAVFSLAFCVNSLNIDRHSLAGQGPESTLFQEAGPGLTIVSAQYGEKDRVRWLPSLPDGVQGFLFTDQSRDHRERETTTGRGWKIVNTAWHLEEGQEWSKLDTHGNYSLSVLGDSPVRPVMSAKFYKMNAHLLPELKDAHMVLWTDSVTINEGRLNTLLREDHVVERAAKLLGNNTFLVQKHELRKRVAAEIPKAAKRAAQNTMVPQEVVEQEMFRCLDFMKSQGFRDDVGLYKMEQFLFDARSPKARKALALWWQLTQDWSFRDQISLPWALQKSGVEFKAPCTSGPFPGQSCLASTVAETNP